MSAPSKSLLLGRRGLACVAGATVLSTMGHARGAAPRAKIQTLTVAIPTDPVGIEPGANRAEPIGSEIILNIFDTLVAWVHDTDAEPAPRLATSWTVSDSGDLYRFRLHPGVLFHDGTPCDAEAVRFSLARSLAMNSYLRASLDTLTSIEVEDATTVTFRLARPVPFFLSLLAQPQAAIVSPTAVRRLGARFGERPVGTGAFRLERYDPDVSIVLAANERYFRGAPQAAQLVYLIIADASTRRMMLEAGDIDLCQPNGQLTALPMEDVRVFRTNPAIQVIEASSGIMRQLEFNNLLHGAGISDIRVRQAIGYAIDYDGLIEGVLAGTVERAYGPLPPASRGADPALRATAFRYDPARARDLLRQAGLGPHGLRFTIYTFDGSFWATVATFLQANLADVGIDVAIEQMEFPALRARHVEGRFAVALDGREAWYNDPDAHLTIGYLSSLATTAMTFRMPPDPGLDGLVLQAQSCMDLARRQALYDELQEAIAARVPAIYLFSNKIIVFARAGITGLDLRGAPPLCEYWGVRKQAAA